MGKLNGKTALVTGASGGIGYELALQCAKDGASLVLVARNSAKLKEIKQDFESRYGIQVTLFPTDLSQPGKSLELYNNCRQQNITVDYLINNAGYGDYRNVIDADADTYVNMLNLNIIALTELSTLFVKDMVKQGRGRILNVASTAAYQPVPRLAAYAASKAYVVSFTEALHAELKGSGVTATVLSPGFTATGFADRAQMQGAASAQGAQADPAYVAKAGYKAMLQGKLYVIPGLMNKLLALGSKLMPSRRAVLAVAALVSREGKK